MDKNCSSETGRFKRSFGHEKSVTTELLHGMGNFSNGLGNNVQPRGIKNALDDYLELTEDIDLVEDNDGITRSSLVGLDVPPNFMECNSVKVKKQKVDELNWFTDEDEEQKSYRRS